MRLTTYDRQVVDILRDLQWRRIDGKAMEQGSGWNTFLVPAIIRMYAKCGCMASARGIFESVKPTLVSWNTLLHGYAANGEAHTALKLFSRMKAVSGCAPDSFTYVAALKACTSLASSGKRSEALQRGKEIHSEIDGKPNLKLTATLINMYAKCGSMEDAKRIFDASQNPDVVSWNALLLGYAENGEAGVALDLFIRMRTSTSACNAITYIAALKACTSLAVSGKKEEALQRGKTIHLEVGCHLDLYVQSTLIDMYAKCGSLTEARKVFDSIPTPDVVTWNTLISVYAANGQGVNALDLFARMQAMGGCKPDVFSYLAALKSCTSLAANGEKSAALERGKQIHSEIGDKLELKLQATLVDMYGKCGSMVDARRALDALSKPDVVTWTALLSGYVENGQAEVALEVFKGMKNTPGCKPDAVTYAAALKACASLASSRSQEEALRCGRKIHSELGRHLLDPYVHCALIDMYAKSGSMADARAAFDALQDAGVVSWNALLLACVECGEGLAALDLFTRMKKRGCAPNSVTYVAALKACTSLAVHGDREEALERGRDIHADAGCHLDAYVQSALIEMYAKCGCMVGAQSVFDSLRKPDRVSWNTLILGYAADGEGRAALETFSRMKCVSECAPDSFTYVAAFKACVALAASGEKDHALELGRAIHSGICCSLDVYVRNTLIDMYSKCGSMADARCVFDSVQNPDVIAWNALLLGYADANEGEAALGLFARMKEASVCAPNAVTYVAALKACASLAANGEKQEALKRGREIHSECGCQLDLWVCNTLIDMYASCSSMADARRVFNAVDKPDVVSWNALLHGYAANEQGGVALELFGRMKNTPGCLANAVTYVAVLKACGQIGALALGRKLHAEVHELVPQLVTSLVDFYGKCGSMAEACEVYDQQPRAREVSAWNALLAGLSRFGDAGFASSLIEAQQSAGLRPDGVTFVSVLACFSHAGLVEQARQCLQGMAAQYGVSPDVRHYTCVVDALGRANRLTEAVDLVQSMPCRANSVTWMTLLGACRKWRNAEVGRWAFRALAETDCKNGKNASAYLQMLHIYRSCNLWEEQESC